MSWGHPWASRESISLTRVFSEPAQDKLILLWAQKTLEVNLCDVEEVGSDGEKNLYKYI